MNALAIVDLNFNSEIDTVREKDLDPISKLNYGFGVGYTHNNKLSLELRIITDRELLSISSGHNAKYRTLSLMFGYNLF